MTQLRQRKNEISAATEVMIREEPHLLDEFRGDHDRAVFCDALYTILCDRRGWPHQDGSSRERGVSALRDVFEAHEAA